MLALSRLVGSLPCKRLIISNSRFLLSRKLIGQARYLFDEISHRDLSSLNALLSHHVRTNDAQTAWALFQRMHQHRSDLDPYTFTPVFGACAALSDAIRGRQIHGLVVKNGSEFETITKTAIIDMYSKCDNINDSLRVFEEMTTKDVVTWTTMISSYFRQGLADEALRLFKEMQREGVEFSGFTLSSVLKACAFLGSVCQGKQIHALVITMGYNSTILGTALLDFYSDSGFIQDAMKVFFNLNCKKDDAVYNSLISACVKNRKYEEALSILRDIKKPNVIALTSVLVACSENSSLLKGKEIHCVVIRFGFDWDTQLCNALLDLYAKCGNVLSARFVFSRISRKDVISWTSIIDAYGSQGCGGEALELFREMEEESGISPNDVTFLTVLSACGHSCLVEEGRKCFSSMKEKYRLNPSPDHYACFMDLLGRAGLIEEVYNIYCEMGENSVKLTSSFLNACRISLDVVRGEFAAKRLFELEPENPGNYVSVSNFYAAIGRWDNVEELRDLMREKGLTKEAGSSWIAVG